jgi:AraC-like DNA-binding protein
MEKSRVSTSQVFAQSPQRGVYEVADNLVRRPGVKVTTSVSAPTGAASADPSVLLNETAYLLDGQPLSTFLSERSNTYATYDGHNRAKGPDWYAIDFPEPTTFNSVDMTMQCPHRDGGWWTSLRVEIRRKPEDSWCEVENLRITPPYRFDDTPVNRPPYQTFALLFENVKACSVRLIGTPGGLAEFTFLARIAVYHRDMSKWNPNSLPPPPVPLIFRLISPSVIFDFSESLVKVTGLTISVPLIDHYLDEWRYQQWWRRIRRNYEGEPELWQLLGASLGWDVWRQLENHPDIVDYSTSPHMPYVRLGFNQTIGRSVAPIIIEGKVLGELFSHPVIVRENYDEIWHRQYARTHDILWSDYKAAVERSPHMSIEQLEGIASLLGMITNTIANLSYRNRNLERELDGVQKMGVRTRERREIVRLAIDFMERNIEEDISIDDVARHVGLSSTYFSTLFAQETGHPPNDALINMRLNRAKDYLTHTQMSVLEVCVALGYNPGYFSRLFKRRVGISPGQYARQTKKARNHPMPDC